MSEDVQEEVMEMFVNACEKDIKDIENAAKVIKETLDRKFESSTSYWHVVVGEAYAFEITCELENSIIQVFFGGNMAVLAWRY